MKIALVSRGCRPGAGIERYTLELARRLVKQHTVDVISDPAECINCGARIVPIQVPKKPLWRSILLFSRLAGLRAQAGQYDIVHTQGSDSQWADVVTAHSCHGAGLRASLKVNPRLYNRFKKYFNPAHRAILAMERKALTSAYTWLAVSRRVSRQLRATYPDLVAKPWQVIYPGVNLPDFIDNRLPAALLRQALGWPKEAMIFALVANHPRLKGADRLIQALAYTQAKNIFLIIASDRGRDFGLQRLARCYGVAQRVYFLAVGQDPSLLYLASDVIADLPEYESFGITILEAMAYARPLLLTRNVGAAELLHSDQETVLLPALVQPRTVAQAMDFLTAHADVRERMGRAARNTAEKYSWDRMVLEIEKVYYRIAEIKKLGQAS